LFRESKHFSDPEVASRDTRADSLPTMPMPQVFGNLPTNPESWRSIASIDRIQIRDRHLGAHSRSEHSMASRLYRPGVEYRAVYLPEGDWYDWWTGERLNGNQHTLANAPLEQMPMFVKAGAIIPMQPVMQYVNERPVDQIRLRVWSGQGEFTIYEDDGQSFAYRSNQWSTTTFRVYEQENITIVEIDQRQGEWQPNDREIIVELVGVGEHRFSDQGRDQELRTVIRMCLQP
jgi:hypothetical protein